MQRSPDFELDPLESELLTELCRSLDSCDQLQAELKGLKSLAVLGGGQWRAHPFLSALDVQRKSADRLVGSLGISMPGSSGAGKATGHQRKAARVVGRLRVRRCRLRGPDAGASAAAWVAAQR